MTRLTLKDAAGIAAAAAVVTALQAGLALLLTCAPARADQAPRAAPQSADGFATARQKALLRLYASTRLCMRDGASAMLRLGQRDPAVVVAFVMTSCSAPLRRELVTNAQFTHAQAYNLALELAATAVADAAPGLL